MTPDPGEGLLLRGLDGSNPLAFLTAVGTLRSITQMDGARLARLGWSRAHGAWRAVLFAEEARSGEELCELLSDHLAGRATRPEFDLGCGQDNLSVAPKVFEEFLSEALSTADREDRTTVDFAAAFGSEALPDGRGRIMDTALRTMSGAGWQHFLGAMRRIIETTTAEHLYRTLFQPWRYDDPLRGLSLRWEPTEDRRHAYQWVDPSKDPMRGRSGSMLGANRLAIEALPLLPTAPEGRRLRTAGFRRTARGEVVWTWPIWERPVAVPVVRSLLTLRELQRDTPDRVPLAGMGIAEVYRTTRINVEYYRNFTPAVAV